jgi:hypothetical protein
MKYYKYKQVQRMTFFGYDDVNMANPTSLSKISPQTVIGPITNDTKTMRFNINRLSGIQLSQNAKLVLESIYIPNIGDPTRAGPVTVRMNNLNTSSHDSQNNGYSSTLIYATEVPNQQIVNTDPGILYNFSIDQNFFKNGYVEFELTFPNVLIVAGMSNLARFNISFVVYDVDEQDLILKDTPDVDFKNFGAHFNINNGRIPK